MRTPGSDLRVPVHTLVSPKELKHNEAYDTQAAESEKIQAEDGPLLAASIRASTPSEGEASSSGRHSCHIIGLIWNSGVSCMVIASFIQSLCALFVKLTNGRVPVFEVVAVRSGMCMAATLATMKWRGVSPAFGSRSNLLPLFIRGAAGASSMSLYYFAIFKLPLADVMTLFFTHPAMVVALAWACRGETVRWLGAMGMLFSLLGVVLVAQPPFLTGGAEWSSQHLTGVSLTLAAAFLAAVAFVSIRFVGKGEASLTVALWFHSMGVASSVLPLLMRIPEPPMLPLPFDMLMLLGVALGSFSSHTFLARAFQVENASKCAAAGYLQVVFGHMYGIVLLHDSESLFGIFGSLVICIGVIAVSWPAPPQPVSEGKGDADTEATIMEMAPLSDSDIEEGRIPVAKTLTGDSKPADSIHQLHTAGS